MYSERCLRFRNLVKFSFVLIFYILDEIGNFYGYERSLNLLREILILDIELGILLG